MKLSLCSLGTLVLLLGLCAPADALLIDGQDIIDAPEYAIDDFPGAENDHQQAFNEAQDVLLPGNIIVDGAYIPKGTVVDSHMIFLNTPVGTGAIDEDVLWTFDGEILGVMSDFFGYLEVRTSWLLGAPGTIYPDQEFGARGLEPWPANRYAGDGYLVDGNTILVDMGVSEPGDWIRVITASPSGTEIPEPGTLLLFGAGLFGALARSRRRSSV